MCGLNRRCEPAFLVAGAERFLLAQHVELPSTLTGVPARIVLLLGDFFPMIRAILSPRVAIFSRSSSAWGA